MYACMHACMFPLKEEVRGQSQRVRAARSSGSQPSLWLGLGLGGWKGHKMGEEIQVPDVSYMLVVCTDTHLLPLISTVRSRVSYHGSEVTE